MLDEKTYRQFIEAVELTDVVLSKVSLQLDRLDTSLPSSLAADTKFKSSRVMLDDNVLRLRGSFTVIGHTSSEELEERIFSLLFDVDLVYSISGFNTGDLGEEELSELLGAFESRNVPLNVWPYAREFVSSMTVRMGFPALVLSSYKVIR
jgi:preprotein translocase subunit SecB